MKLLLFDDYKLGVLKGDRVVDVSSAAPSISLADATLRAEAMMEVLIGGFAGYRGPIEAIAAREVGVPLAQVKICPPLPRPHGILCAFSNYQDREQDNRMALDFFHKNATAVAPSGGTVVIPNIPEASVYQPEPEIAYLIGKTANNVSEADALSYVFGYCNFIDVSARGVPNRHTPFLTKALNLWAPLGPVILTADEVPDPQNLRVRLWLNGEQKQDYNTASMSYSIAEQIAWLSQYITLKPGDVISCGTHHVGLSPINDGDRVEMEVEGMERLQVAVKSYAPRSTGNWRPPGVRDH